MTCSTLLSSCVLLVFLCKFGVICQSYVKEPQLKSVHRRSLSNMYTYLYNEEEEMEYMKALEEEEEEKMNDLLLGGPLENRKFVFVSTLPRTGRTVEGPYRFDEDDNDYLRDKREDDAGDNTPAQDNQQGTDQGKDGVGRSASNPFPSQNKTKAQELLSNETIDDLDNPPLGFNTTRLIIKYTHQLTKLEKAGDSKAKLGDRCQPKTTLEHDECERAAFPNKNKMVCNGVNDSRMNFNGSFEKNTCVCKFYRVLDTVHEWEQMRIGKIRVNDDPEVFVCLVPQFGVCNHRIATGHHDTRGRPVYEVDVCQGHFQCDNTEYYKYLKKENILEVSQHCSEEDFLDQFQSKVRDKILLCSKPNSRRFSNYDEFKFYCLPQIARDPNQSQNYKTYDAGESEHTDVHEEE